MTEHRSRPVAIVGGRFFRTQPHAPARGHSAKAGNWRVIHACEYARDILSLVEGQITAGMRPYLVTPQGAGSGEQYLSQKELGEPQSLSLLRAWQDVRVWRKSLMECDPENNCDLVHTHSFASGMAGVRNLSCVVYNLGACIEELAIHAGLCERGSWMGRSFRVAEQFIVARAQAVVVHALGMKSAAVERGAAPDAVFVIPHPVSVSDDNAGGDRNLLQDRLGVPAEAVSFFVPNENQVQEAERQQSVAMLLEAYAIAVVTVPHSRLLLELPPSWFTSVRSRAQDLGIGGHVIPVDKSDAPNIVRNATVVVSTGNIAVNEGMACQPNEFMLRSMLLAKPLLAADVPCNREVSPQGAGCLWFTRGDSRELGHRMAFLGEHQEFRESLAASGRTYIAKSRTSAAVGQQYDAVYRYALGRKKAGGPGQQINHLLPLNCAV